MDNNLKKILIFDIDNFIWKFPLNQFFDLSNEVEIFSGNPTEEQLTCSSKKVIVKNWWLYESGYDGPSIDYSWADLIICINTEVALYPYPQYLEISKKLLNNKNVLHLLEGIILDSYYDHETCFSPLLYFIKKSQKINEDFCNLDFNLGFNQKPFLFDALLGDERYHRLYIFQNLKKYNLLDKSLVFLYNKDPKKPYQTYQSAELEKLDLPAILEYKKQAQNTNQRHTTFMSDKIIQQGQYAEISFLISPKIYESSWFSIIAETNYEKFHFITEKTAKCFLAKRIFVMFSSLYMLRFLRDQGFKTFNDIIDESYDVELDNAKRFKMAFEQVIYLSKANPNHLYSWSQEVLNYNFNLIRNGSLHTEKIKEFLKYHFRKL